jgi:hypothetical protein
MSQLVRFEGGESKTTAETPSAQVELKHFQNVTNSVVQDALNVWADLWAELEDNVACGVALKSPEKESEIPVGEDRGRGAIQPSCGWPQFLEKMWILRQNLDFLARFSRQQGLE